MTGDDVSTAFERIGEVAKSLDWQDLISLPLDQAWDKGAGKAQEAWGHVDEFGAKALARLEMGVDQVWAKIQEPVAKFADWLQGLGKRFGILEEGTASWGDAVRGVGDVGKTVVGSLGYGLGYLEGWFKKLGGVIGEHLISPLTVGLAAALKVAGEALSNLASDPALKAAFGAAGINIDGIAKGLDRSADRLPDWRHVALLMTATRLHPRHRPTLLLALFFTFGITSSPLVTRRSDRASGRNDPFPPGSRSIWGP